MKDNITTIQDIKKIIAAFIKERNWEQFHSPKNLSMNISVEASELMEHFLWVDSADGDKTFEKKQVDIEHELADIFMGLIHFCNRYNLDLTTILTRKLQIAHQKYPVAKCYGKSDKYTEYQ